MLMLGFVRATLVLSDFRSAFQQKNVQSAITEDRKEARWDTLLRKNYVMHKKESIVFKLNLIKWPFFTSAIIKSLALRFSSASCVKEKLVALCRKGHQ